ncbi:MAG: hypothetical protein ACYSWP_00790 [Planctomycetota bacterium]|jgi:hypothetical protein
MDTDFSKPMNDLRCEQEVLVLRSITSRLSFFGWSLFGALFGLAPILIFYHLVQAAWSGKILFWILSLVMFPFAFFGIALVLFPVYSFLQLFNPPIKLTLRPKQLMPGDNIELSWNISWRPEVIRNMKISLEATFTKGGGRSEKTKTIRTIDILQLDNPLALNTGNTRFTIPPDVLPTSKPDHREREISWSLELKAATRGKRADIDDSFKVSILPVQEPETPADQSPL